MTRNELVLDANSLARVPFVPSNMVIEGSSLFVADTGHGRVLRFDLASPATELIAFETTRGCPPR